jgi:hypothetical protein
MWIMLLETKDEALKVFVTFQARAEAEAGARLDTLRTDRGGEFTGHDFVEHCIKQGVQWHLTAPYTPEQNGVVERRNQSVMGMSRSMLKAMSVPGWLWGEAVATAVFILNRSPTRSVEGSTPYEAWYGVKPSVSFLRTFGCVAHVKQGNKRLSKLEDRSTPMVFIGYEPGSKAWRFYNLETKRVHVSRDAIFEEDRAWNWSAEDIGEGEPFHMEYVAAGGDQLSVGDGSRREAVPSSETPEGSVDLDADAEDAPLRFRNMEDILGPSSPPDLAERVFVEELLTAIENEPATVEEALHSKEWRAAMLEELASIRENRTWSLVKLPKGHRPIGLK